MSRPVRCCRLPVRVIGLIVGTVLVALSCSGPSSDPGRTADESGRVYHVQLNQTKEKEAANQDLARAIVWWDDQSSASLPTPLSDGQHESPVQVAWQAPFYRVRLGPFASRSAAKEVLTAARPTFPKAFIAPGDRREE